MKLAQKPLLELVLAWIGPASALLCLTAGATNAGDWKLLDHGADGLDSPYLPCLTDAEYAQVERDVAQNEARMIAEGILPEDDSAKAHPTFIFPLRPAEHLDDIHFEYTLGFVDHNQQFGPGNQLDYACGSRTYDGQAFGWHRGTDYELWPYEWNKMYDDDVEIVAAAAGVVVGRYDWNLDTSCAGAVVGPSWNGYIIRHDGGSRAMYVHMKRGTLPTSVVVGSRVEAGDYLGIVGSSGSSIRPHLHFEVYEKNGTRVDPYAGPCNSLNGDDSWWIEQPPYEQHKVHRISTHGVRVWIPNCTEPVEKHERSTFHPGETITYYLWGTDGAGSGPFLFSVLDPQGQPVEEWAYGYNLPTSLRKYKAFWQLELPQEAELGDYVFRLEHGSEVHERAFSVAEAPTVPVLWSLDAWYDDDAIALRWELGGDPAIEHIRVWRQELGLQSEFALLEEIAFGQDGGAWRDRAVRPGASYRYRLGALLSSGVEIPSDTVTLKVPEWSFRLDPNHPNPFNPRTTIRFALESPGAARLTIHDLRGARVRTLVDGFFSAGVQTVEWDGKDDRGRSVASGSYSYVLEAAGSRRSQKMLLLK